jgi:hypothetical protein
MTVGAGPTFLERHGHPYAAGPGGFVAGCEACRREATVKQRRQRARRRGLEPVPESTASNDAPEAVADVRQDAASVANATPGPCERATALELETLPAAQSHLALGQAALCMARILDNRLWVTTQPSACRQLSSLMGTIRKASAVPRGRLAVISKMATRPDAGA